MSPNILIRDVHPDVHSVLTARAAAAGQSLQEYLLGLVSDVAQRPTLEEILAQSETETPPTPLRFLRSPLWGGFGKVEKNATAVNGCGR